MRSPLPPPPPGHPLYLQPPNGAPAASGAVRVAGAPVPRPVAPQPAPQQRTVAPAIRQAVPQQAPQQRALPMAVPTRGPGAAEQPAQPVRRAAAFQVPAAAPAPTNQQEQEFAEVEETTGIAQELAAPVPAPAVPTDLAYQRKPRGPRAKKIAPAQEGLEPGSPMTAGVQGVAGHEDPSGVEVDPSLPADPPPWNPEVEPQPSGVVGGVSEGPDDVIQTAQQIAQNVEVPREADDIAGKQIAVYDASSGLQGDWGAEDLKLPTLRIVAGMGKLSERFNLGTLIMGDEILMPTPDLRNPHPDDVIHFIPITLKKAWRENLTQEEVAGGLMPRIVDTANEAEALGGITTWVGNSKPTWSPSATIIMLVRQPNFEPGYNHPMFTTDIDGQLYAIAVHYATNTGYNHSAKILYNATQATLRIPVLGPDGQPQRGPGGMIMKRPYLPRNVWTWRTVKRAAGQYSVFGPELKPTQEESSPGVREQADGFIGG